ncbi:MAG: TolC family outer membrane protein [Steroidobacter sp.]
MSPSTLLSRTKLLLTITPFAVCAFSLTVATSAVHATSLLDIYDQAAMSDPTIRAAAAVRLATREARPQAWSSLLPNIAATANWSNIECGGYTQCVSSGVPVVTSQSGNVITQRGGTYGITAVEQINIPAMLRTLHRTDYTLAQADLTYHAAEQTLAVRVAQRYFNVLLANDTLNSAQAGLAAFNQQLEEQQSRFEVGLSAETDVQEARAARDSASATVISAKRSLASAQEQLREVAGSLVNDLAAPGDDMPLIMPEPQSEDAWVRKALDGNLNLATSRIAMEAASYDLGTLKTHRYPSLSIGASYNNSEAFRDFKTHDSTDRWIGTVLSVGISVPIYSGGMISSQIHQGEYELSAARQNVALITRQTDSSARDAYLGMQSAIALVQANKQAMESAQLALNATQAGFEVGTRTTIDVLNSRKSLLLAEVQYQQSRYQYITQLITLRQITGELNRHDLEQINGWLTR